MKRISTKIRTAITLMAIFAITGAHAQFSYGVKAGVNHSTFKLKDHAEMKQKTGVTTGLFATYSFSPKIDLQVEALYTQSGAKKDYQGTTGKFDFRYVNLPVLAKYNVWNGIYAIAGAQFGYLISAKTELSGHKENIKDEVKKTDISMVFGTGYQMRNGLCFDVRYVPGITDISNNSTSIKNVSWQASIGYRVSL